MKESTEAMESINEEQQVSKRKRGEVCEDGMVFWARNAKGDELWMTQEKFDAEKARIKAYRLEYNPKFYAENKAELNAKSKEWRDENPERHRQTSINWRREFPEKQRASTNSWIARNKEANRVIRRNYEKRCREENRLTAEKHRMRCRLRHALRNAGLEKKSKTKDMLGCDWPTLVKHIESHFLPNMGWHNRQLWELDHHMPLASAKTIEELTALAHFSNIRPLWTPMNRSKADKIPEIVVDIV